MASPPSNPPAPPVHPSDAATDRPLGHGSGPVRFDSHAFSPPSMFLAVVLMAFLISGCVSLLVRAFSSSTAAMALFWRASHPPLPSSYDRSTSRSWQRQQQYTGPMAQQRRNGDAVGGLKPSHIRSLPVEAFSHDVKKQAGCGYCVVCLSEFREGESVRVLPACMHCFHADCIGMWLHSHSTCPVCRHSLLSLSPVSCWPGLSPRGLEQCILQTWTRSADSGPMPAENRFHGSTVESLALQSSETLARGSTQPLPSPELSSTDQSIRGSMLPADSNCKKSLTDRRPLDSSSENAPAAGCIMGTSSTSHESSSLDSCLQVSGCISEGSASIDHGCLPPSLCSMSSHGRPSSSSSSLSSSLSLTQAASECYSGKPHHSMQQRSLPECCVHPLPPGKGSPKHIVPESSTKGSSADSAGSAPHGK